MRRLLLAACLLWSVLALAPRSHAAILYVDKDSGCPGTGATGTPYCSIQNASNVINPGDSVRIRDSATPYDENVWITRNGTLAAPIIFEPDTGATPILRYTGSGSGDAAIDIRKASYITIRNLTFDGAGVYTSRYAVIVNSTLSGSDAADIHGVKITGNTFKNWGGTAAQASTVNDRGALIITGGYCNPCPARPYGTLVQNNIFDSNRQAHLRIQHADTTLVEGNTFINALCGKDVDTAVNTLGIKINDAVAGGMTGTTIQNNTFRDWESKASCGIAHVGGAYDTIAGVWCDVGPVNGNVIGNRIYNIDQGNTAESVSASQGIFIEWGCTGWVVQNNVIHDIGVTGLRNRGYDAGSAPATWTGTPNQYLNNTVFRTGVNALQVATGKVIVKNNIFHDAGTAQIIFDTANAGVHTVNYNDYFDSAGGNKVGRWGGGTLAFAAWKTACGCDANSINVDPVFVQTTDPEDLHLQLGSPACTAGEGSVSLGAYACRYCR